MRIIKGNNNSFKSTKNKVPKIPKIKAKTAKATANIKTIGVKAKTIKRKNNFKPTISSSIAIKFP